MNSQQKKKKREQNRRNIKLFRERRKARESRALEEDLIYCKDPPKTDDPLSVPKHFQEVTPLFTQQPLPESTVSRPNT